MIWDKVFSYYIDEVILIGIFELCKEKDKMKINRNVIML